MTTRILGILTLIIPLAIGIGALFAAILAHRGHKTKGTLTLLISSILYLLSLIGAVVCISYSFSISFSHYSDPNDFHKIIEVLSIMFVSLLVLSILSYGIGFLLMGLKWKSFSQKVDELEMLAQKLAAEREQV